MSNPMVKAEEVHKRFGLLEVLKGISFKVGWGEGISLVGRNGAGKSTLLALLSRVIKPTSGIVRINGKVAPLLELGSGFIPDLSGYENIFFNGIMLGMPRGKIEEQLEATELPAAEHVLEGLPPPAAVHHGLDVGDGPGRPHVVEVDEQLGPLPARRPLHDPRRLLRRTQVGRRPAQQFPPGAGYSRNDRVRRRGHRAS